MNCLLWNITTFDTNNALPYVAFYEPLRPLVSIARAQNRIKHVMTLLKRKLISASEIQRLCAKLHSELGIDMRKERWGAAALYETMAHHEIWLSSEISMLDVVPFDFGHPYASLLFGSTFSFIYAEQIYSRSNEIRLNELLNKFKIIMASDGGSLLRKKKIGGIETISICWHRYCDDKWPLDILTKPNLTYEMILTHINSHFTICRIKLACVRALRAYVMGDEIMPEDSIVADEFISNNYLEDQIYKSGNYAFIVLVSGPLMMSYSLLRRAFISESIIFDPELGADVLAAFEKANTHLQMLPSGFRKHNIYEYWFAFILALDLPIPNRCVANTYSQNHMFILGPQSFDRWTKKNGQMNKRIFGQYYADYFANLFPADDIAVMVAQSERKRIRDVTCLRYKLLRCQSLNDFIDYYDKCSDKMEEFSECAFVAGIIRRANEFVCHYEIMCHIKEFN